MRIIALIPARQGSKRVSNKNMRDLKGSPLVMWSTLMAISSSKITATWVSTDSIEIKNLSLKFASFVFDRSEYAASDTATDFDVIKEFVDQVECDLIVYLRPTTPFRTSEMVDEAIRIMEVKGYDSLRSVEEMSESAYKCFSIQTGLCKPLTKKDVTDYPNQKLPKTYKPNGYVDIVRPEIIRSGSLWGEGRYAFITPRTIEIDTPEDFEYAQWYAHNKY